MPADYDALLALPGVGSYTAAAIASFAYRQRHVVLDTNVRRVLARIDGGVERTPAQPRPRPSECGRSATCRSSGPRAARWAVASMELGALVCTARSPRCESCPVADRCRWRRLGNPSRTVHRAAASRYEGTDRQCRGALLAVLRSTDGSGERRGTGRGLAGGRPANPGA